MCSVRPFMTAVYAQAVQGSQQHAHTCCMATRLAHASSSAFCWRATSRFFPQTDLTSKFAYKHSMVRTPAA